ncbi:MAG: HTH domain-containing protein, partial [Lachnospiraceae bacterium]|nr:HTH domain-containing protein [Lachnospiraceae bacterium]
MTSKEKVLKILEKNKETYTSGEDIAKELNLSRNAVWKAINELKKEGYEVTAVTNKG